MLSYLRQLSRQCRNLNAGLFRTEDAPSLSSYVHSWGMFKASPSLFAVFNLANASYRSSKSCIPYVQEALSSLHYRHAYAAAEAPPQSSAISPSSLTLRIMMSRPMVTMINSAKPNHPSTMAVVPTPETTLPLPRS